MNIIKGRIIKFSEKEKSKELDLIKALDEIIEQYNKTQEGHYILRLVKAVKRGMVLKLKKSLSVEADSESQLVYLWELNHEKDIKQVENWKWKDN